MFERPQCAPGARSAPALLPGLLFGPIAEPDARSASALIRLWQEKRGEVGPEDLSGELIVQLGLATEDLNRQWYERITTKMRFPVPHQ